MTAEGYTPSPPRPVEAHQPVAVLRRPGSAGAVVLTDQVFTLELECRFDAVRVIHQLEPDDVVAIRDGCTRWLDAREVIARAHIAELDAAEVADGG